MVLLRKTGAFGSPHRQGVLMAGNVPEEDAVAALLAELNAVTD